MTIQTRSVRLDEYEALVNGAAVLKLDGAEPFSVSGVDRADFLHRITTNDIKSLTPEQSAVTVLTDATARILFVFIVLCRDEDLLLLPAAGQTESLMRHLRGQIFFMDQVELSAQRTPMLGEILVIGLNVRMDDQHECRNSQ